MGEEMNRSTKLVGGGKYFFTADEH